MTDYNTQGAQYSYWKAAGGDWLDDEAVARLRSYHGDETELFRCESCDDDVHVVSGDYREQTKAWIRYGPFFLCGECIARAFELPALPGGFDGPWWEVDLDD